MPASLFTEQPFPDRAAAGQLLAAELASLADRRPIVFGLPRCGVPVAYEVAQHLGAPLDVALVRTVRAADGNDELLATVMEGDPPTIRIQPHKPIARELIADAVDELEKRLQLSRGRGGSRPVSPSGRTAIVVDQAITSGHAVAGAIELLRRAGARSVVVAAPVASEPGVARITPLAERVVTLRRVPDVGALEQHYADWRQVTHQEALACLEKARE
jgi:putative phosphoribosyl transferase